MIWLNSFSFVFLCFCDCVQTFFICSCVYASLSHQKKSQFEVVNVFANFNSISTSTILCSRPLINNISNAKQHQQKLLKKKHQQNKNIIKNHKSTQSKKYKINGLNIALVPANVIHLSFGPCKKKNSEISPCKKFCLLKIPLGPFKPSHVTKMPTWRTLTVHLCPRGI